jgi:hypothetical protein
VLDFSYAATLTGAKKKKKQAYPVLDFPSSVCRKVRRCKSNEWIYPQKQACLKKEEKKHPLQNSKATTRAQGSNTSKTNRPTKTNSTSAQVTKRSPQIHPFFTLSLDLLSPPPKPLF